MIQAFTVRISRCQIRMLLVVMVLLSGYSALVKQVQNDAQSDQTNKSVIAKRTQQRRQIRDNTPKKWYRSTKQDLYCDSNCDQQQCDLSYFTKPSFYLIQYIHYDSPKSNPKQSIKYIVILDTISQISLKMLKKTLYLQYLHGETVKIDKKSLLFHVKIGKIGTC